MADGDITRMLHAAATGDHQAAADLLPVVYGELRALAAAYMDKTPVGQTLQPTALVHEAYLRLVGKGQHDWQDRGHFFFAAARAMRDILVEQARKKASLKHGGDRRRIDADKLVIAFDSPPDELLALNSALESLERDDTRKHRLVMLRFFAGLTTEEAAEVIGVSVRTAERDWRFVKAWLHKRLAGNGPGAGATSA